MKVDVLAVLDYEIARYRSQFNEVMPPLTDLIEARAAVADVIEALYMALPYVTDAEMYPEQFKPGTVQRHVKQIRDALAKVQP